MSETADLRAALEARLATLSGLPASTTWAKENEDLTPDLETPHLRLRLAFDPPVSHEQPASLARIWKSGVFEVRCYYPPLAGSAAADLVAETILDGFPYGLELTSGSTTVQISRRNGRPAPPRRWGGGLDEDKQFWVVLCEVPWQIVAANTL